MTKNLIALGLAAIAVAGVGCSGGGGDNGSADHAPPPGPNAVLDPPRAGNKNMPKGPGLATPGSNKGAPPPVGPKGTGG